MIGRTLSHYVIVERIGEGGMGVVYRGQDTRLERAVAIKVLNHDRLGGSQWRERFVQEARAASALNHPHIVAVYDIDRVEGIDFIAMEYVAGRTLHEVIGGKPLPLRDALHYLSQIADALSAAHDAGVVHRDLKPANVIVTPSGQVKLLDFGLAKSIEAVDPLGGAPTATAPVALTEPGMVVGTAAYMSPEQLSGRPVDRRSDVWAFGCVLFEALTGRMAFGRRSSAETVARVLEGQPEMALLPAATPPTVRRLLDGCLQKDVERRLRHLDPVWLAALDAPSASPQRSIGWPAAAAVALALAIGAVGGWLASARMARPPGPASTVRLSAPFAYEGPTRMPLVTVSPDGAALVYVGGSVPQSRLHLKRMDRVDAAPLAGTEGAVSPFFSPDGRSVAFFADARLKRLSLADGSVQTICQTRLAYGGAWGGDGNIVFGVQNGPLMRVSAAGGAPEALTTLREGESAHRWPAISPTGKSVIFTTTNSTGPGLEESHLVAQSLTSDRREVLTIAGTFAMFDGDGTHLLVAQGSTLHVVPYDESRLTIAGASVPLVEGVMQATTGAAQIGGSPSVLAYLAGGTETRRLVWVDRHGTVQPLDAPPRLYVHPRLSPDGRRVAVAITEPKNDIWIYDLERSTLSRLTVEGSNAYPIWTPDSRRITYVSSQQGRPPNAFWIPADGSGPEERLMTSENVQVTESWLRDGKTLIFVELRSRTTGWDILTLPLTGDRRPVDYLTTRFLDGTPQISPSGRYLAYISDESGTQEIHVRSFPGPGVALQVSTGGASQAAWRADERELYFRTGHGQMMAVPTSTTPQLTIGRPVPLFDDRFATIQGKNYDVTPDGQRFLMVQAEEPALPRHVTIVLNWMQDLKGRLH